MEDKIEVGEYVRTKKGKIGICISISNIPGRGCQAKYLIQWSKIQAYYISNQTIINHSKNITDLIEVGDYVNSQYVSEKFYDYANKEWNIILATTQYLKVGKNRNDIKSIVTKEMFKSVLYEVE